MADNKNYYYLKLKDNFYDSEEMIILQNMQDGYLYSDILLKLYLRSLKNNGKLMFKDIIPYTPIALAQVVRHQVGTVEKALKIFAELGLVEILDNGAIYMAEIQNFIGESSTEADRKRLYRAQINNDKLTLGQMSDKCPDKSPPEIEIELELEKKINKNIRSANAKQNTHPTIEEVKTYCKEINSNVNAEHFIDYYESNGWKVGKNTMKDWKATVRNWSRKEEKKLPNKTVSNKRMYNDLDKFIDNNK